MARDNRLVFTVPSSGVVTLAGAANAWNRQSSNALNVGGSTFYAAASGPVPPATETAGVGSSTLSGNMGCEYYVQLTLAQALTIGTGSQIQVLVEAASDAAGSAGTDWTAVSGGFQCSATGTKRINLQVIDSAKPWLRISVLTLHGSVASTGTVTITNAFVSIGRDGVQTAG